MVSGMLTAIRDFVRDSFGAGTEETLDAFRVGETAVVVEQGPRAVLAAVVRGTPPPEIRVRLKEALESIHLQRGEELEAFDGDNAPFEAMRPVLQDCLHTQFRAEEQARAFAWRRWAIVGAVLIAILAVWAGLRWRERRQFDDFLARLRREPGIVVIDSGRRDGRFFVAGLRDPLAKATAASLDAAGLTPESVEQRWEPYSSHDRTLALERARAILRWPESVRVELRDGVLTARGERRLRVDRRGRPPRTADSRRDAGRHDCAWSTRRCRTLKTSIESTSIVFPKGSAEVPRARTALLDEVRARLRVLDGDGSGVRYRAWRCEIVGHADTDGTEDQNFPLSTARAESARERARTWRARRRGCRDARCGLRRSGDAGR